MGSKQPSTSNAERTESEATPKGASDTKTSPPSDAVRDELAGLYAELIELAYDPAEINWLDFPVAREDVQYQHIRRDANTWARSGRERQAILQYNAKFGLNYDWWVKSSPEERLAVLSHELGHLQEHHHKPSFWENVLSRYQRLEQQHRAVEEATGWDLNWNRVRREVVMDANVRTVDLRSETPYERRLANARTLGVSESEVEPYSGMRVRPVHRHRWEYETVPLSDVEFEYISPEEVCRWLRSPTRNGVDQRGNEWRVGLPRVEESEDGYRVIDEDERLSMLVDAHYDDTETVLLAVEWTDDEWL